MKDLCGNKIIRPYFNHILLVLSVFKRPVFAIKAILAVCIMLFALSCGKEDGPDVIVMDDEMPIEEIASDNKTHFRIHMGDLDDSYDSLTESIDTLDWGNIRKYAMAMKNTSPVVLTGKGKDTLPKDFVLLDTKFHFYTLELVEAAESREMVKLNVAFEKVLQTCDDCHVKYKKKD